MSWFKSIFNSEYRKQSRELKKLLMSNKIRTSKIHNTISFLSEKFQSLLTPRSQRLLFFPYKMSKSDYVRQLRDAKTQALIDMTDLWILEHPKILYDDEDCLF